MWKSEWSVRETYGLGLKKQGKWKWEVYDIEVYDIRKWIDRYEVLYKREVKMTSHEIEMSWLGWKVILNEWKVKRQSRTIKPITKYGRVDIKWGVYGTRVGLEYENEQETRQVWNVTMI